MKHLGDITKIKGSEAPPVDCITGGSPCQDLSIAGKRAGLAGERSGLFMEQIRLIKEMREHDKSAGRLDDNIRPRWMVWENVPGAFSSNGGEDFRAVLEETARVKDPDAIIPRPADGKWTPAGCIMGDGWSIAWRVHDAQFWGVPQRRRRISLVADFAGGGAPEVLFERKSVSRDFETSREEAETAPGEFGGSAEKAFGETGVGFWQPGIQTIRAEGENRPSRPSNLIVGTITPKQNKIRGDIPLVVDKVYGLSSFGKYSPGCSTLRAEGGDLGGGSENLVAEDYCVRRLTPTECERLQGYPDGWTDIGEWTDSKGKKHNGDADAPRYKALGNSIALPFWFWLLRRISATYCRPATLGSLFDGIGGFPLCWERCNGAGTAIWASEIEEFPIAVTKKHFAEE